VQNCDTLHSLIVQHRKREDIMLHAEHYLMRKLAPESKVLRVK
jgi:hypothetical protein